MTAVDAVWCDSHIQLAVENVQHSYSSVFLCFWDTIIQPGNYISCIAPLSQFHRTVLCCPYRSHRREIPASYTFCFIASITPSFIRPCTSLAMKLSLFWSLWSQSLGIAVMTGDEVPILTPNIKRNLHQTSRHIMILLKSCMVLIGTVSCRMFTELLTAARGRTLSFRCKVTSPNVLPTSLFIDAVPIATAASQLILSFPMTPVLMYINS